MAGKSDSGDGSGEHGVLPEWNSGETEMLRSLFLEEAEKHLGRITEAQKSLAHASAATLDISPDVVDVLFRHLHTLKGSAGSVGFDAVARAAHDLEDLCTEIRRGQLAPTFGILERIDEGVAEIRALLSSARLAVPPPLSSGPPETDAAPREMVERRRTMERRAVTDRRASGEGALRVDVERLDALLESVGDLGDFTHAPRPTRARDAQRASRSGLDPARPTRGPERTGHRPASDCQIGGTRAPARSPG